jgi:hypothetical protein
MSLEELVAHRWDWSERSIAELRSRLFAADDHLPDTDQTHVMVVGDSQAGKTTLLVRLLGVTEPVAAAEIEEVLRAGRAKGNSATAAPIRYRWSSDPSRWMLIRDESRTPEWLTSDELYDSLVALRSPDQRRLRWNMQDRPWEIGLPGRLADQQVRSELRILDLPGLFARSPAEQDAAHALVSRFAPVMSLVIFVHTCDKMADAFNDPAIRGSAHLAAWTENVENYRVVLTRSFKDASVQRKVARLIKADPYAKDVDLAELVRRHLAENLAASLSPTVPAEDVARVLYPVDLGDSWQSLCDTKETFAARVEPARDLIFKALVESLAVAADDELQHLAAPDLTLRIATRIKRQAAVRAEELDLRRAQLAEAERIADVRAGGAADAANTLEARTDTLRRHRAAIADLRTRRVLYRRPAAPEMTGPAVRAHQQKEREAWLAAGQALWSSWLTANGGSGALPLFRSRPPLTEEDVRTCYDGAVACCEKCRFSPPAALAFGIIGIGLAVVRAVSDPPEKCYGKMGAVDATVSTWISTRLVAAAEAALRSAQEAIRSAANFAATAEAERDRQRDEVDVLREAVAALEREDAAESAHEAADRAVALTLKSVLSSENQIQVTGLIERARLSPPDQSGWCLLAALQSMRDLDAMMRTA